MPPLTVWLIGDLDSQDSLQLLRNLVDVVLTAPVPIRVGFVHTPRSYDRPRNTLQLSTLLYKLYSTHALPSINPEELLEIVTAILDHPTDNLDQDGKIKSLSADSVAYGTPLHALTSGGWSESDVVACRIFWEGVKVKLPVAAYDPKAATLLVGGRVSPLFFLRRQMDESPSELTPIPFR